MFQNETLKNHLETSLSVSSQTAVVAEWNMNVPGNIFKIGNYRYRKDDTTYGVMPSIFDRFDSGNFYTGATDADVVVQAGYENDDTTPLLFKYRKDKEKLYYSLEDCFKPFRPRSGINKLDFFNGRYISYPNQDMFLRPRYYMPHKEDQFKYWRSYRTESMAVPGNPSLVPEISTCVVYDGAITTANKEYGISKNDSNGVYYIDDANPFIVYKEEVPANRIVLKVQTNVGDINLGPYTSGNTGTFNDPFYGDTNKTVPQRFKIQYLTSNDEWVNAYEFDQNTLRSDGSAVFGSDGNLTLEFGLNVPDEYQDNFLLVGETTSASVLPVENIVGYAYLVRLLPTFLGTIYVYNGSGYDEFIPEYTWKIASDVTYENTQFVTDVTNPQYYNLTNDLVTKYYREFMWIKGLRVCVESMNTADSPLELIELSPRLMVDLSSKVISYQVNKTLSDLSSSALPVGQLLVSTGSMQIFDSDQSFNRNNEWNGTTGSIIAKYTNKNVKFIFYEVIQNIDNSNYYVPVKYLYSEGIPQTDSNSATVTIALRDFYFYFESMPAPSILLTDVSLSQAVCILLDHIGFSNYVFKRLADEKDPVIPFFFVAPEQNVAEVLNQLAISTQSAMFFDEYNNFVVMSKDYLLDDTTERSVDLVLYGTNNQTDLGVIENYSSTPLTNIISINSQDQKVYNSGVINFTTRYIQKTYGSLEQAAYVDKSWIYKPALLWEVAGSQATRSANAETQQTYVLSAVPLNTNLTSLVPEVSNRRIINNIIDIGENSYWLTRFQGFLFSSGEIIKYDAVEYNVTGVGNVWITNNLEYQKYFSQIPFNGKIYPTGSIRVYAEPYYETIDGILKLKNGSVVRHGRGQFGTPVVAHNAGLDSYWSDNTYIRGCNMRSEYLFEQTGDVTAYGVSSSSTTLYVIDTSRIKVGQVVNKIAGIGTMASGVTKVTAVSTTKSPSTSFFTITVDKAPTVALSNATLTFTGETFTNVAAAGVDVSQTTSGRSQRTGIIRNFLSSSYSAETNVNYLKSAETGTVQSSALVFNGPDFQPTDKPRDFISYVYKDLNGSYKHFGTRVRIIGKIESSGDLSQSPVGGMTYFNIPNADPTQTVTIGGGSAGVCIVNPSTNNGYYFEIAALTSSNIQSFLDTNNDGQSELVLDNIMFYKVKADSTITPFAETTKAIPVKLWGAIGQITVDDGNFTGQYRFIGEQNPTVYDLAIEYKDISATQRRFYLYINQVLVQVVDDNDPLPINNTMGVFVRGTSKAMFENLYALAENYSDNSVFTTGTSVSSIFGDNDNTIDATEALRKYALSGIISSTYYSGIRPSVVPQYQLYFEEFGTIFRECAYFNIKYDRAYPALYAIIAPTFNRLKGYSVSGFTADSYGAEFLIFNNTDTVLSLDETTGNYLRILGVTFTQDTTNTITVDDYLKRKGDLSNPELKGETIINSPLQVLEQYDKVQVSRILYGKNEFSLDSVYIQDQDTAEDILSWIINKNIEPRKAVTLTVFANPTIQLGDIVNINYKNSDGIDIVSSPETRFVVYNIDYSRSVSGPSMTLSLSEV